MSDNRSQGGMVFGEGSIVNHFYGDVDRHEVAAGIEDGLREVGRNSGVMLDDG